MWPLSFPFGVITPPIMRALMPYGPVRHSSSSLLPAAAGCAPLMPTLDAMQRLLTIYSWSADDVRDNLHAYFTVYARALDTKPGDFAHHPNMRISQALTMSNLITQQLGTNSVETLK
jgi:hypothetical protein